MSVNKTVKRQIYIAADALWDLRQGTLTRISAAFAAGVTTQPEYYLRQEDVFTHQGVTLKKDIYQRVFEKFKHEILRCSLHTEVSEFIIQLCKEYVKQTVITPYLEDFSLLINMHPFQLDEKEHTALAQMMQNVFGSRIRLDIVSTPLQDITIEHAKDHFAAMVMYDYATWLNLHTEELKKLKLLEVGLYAPRIYFEDRNKVDPDLRAEVKKMGQDEFMLFADLLGSFVNIQFLPAAVFSASTPLNLPEYRQLVKVL